MKHELTRRTFCKQAGVMGAAVGLGGFSTSYAEEDTGQSIQYTSAPDTAGIRNFKETIAYREIGETGIQVSVFSLGTSKADPTVLDEGLKLGINLIHTSAKYSMGQSVVKVAEAIKGRTDRVHIALKENFSALPKTLEILGVKQVDFLMFDRHDAEDLRKEIPEIRKKFLTLRDKGLVKYAGLTSHKQVKACLDVALEAGIFTCVMPSFGPGLFKELEKQRHALRRKKISVIAMKTKAELADREYPEHIAAVLSDPVTATVCKGVRSIDDLRSWAAAAGRVRTGFWNRRLDRGSVRDLDYTGCGLCGACEESCPHGVATADIVRCIRYYHDAEKEPDMARREFRDMGLAASLQRCVGCGMCGEACPQGIPVPDEIQRAGRLLC